MFHLLLHPNFSGHSRSPHSNSCLHQKPEGSFRSTNRSMALLCENPEWLPAMVWLPMSPAGPGPASTCCLVLHPSLPARCSLYSLALLPFLSHTELVLLYSLCPALFTLGLRVTLPFTSPTLECPWLVVLTFCACGGLICAVLLAHCRHSFDTLPTNDWSNLLTLSPSPFPSLCSAWPHRLCSVPQFAKQTPVTGPLHMLMFLPGISSLPFFLDDRFFSSWLKVTSLASQV